MNIKHLAMVVAGLSLAVHGTTLLLFLNFTNFYIDFGILGRKEIPLSQFSGMSNVINYAFVVTIGGAILLLFGYILSKTPPNTEKPVI